MLCIVPISTTQKEPGTKDSTCSKNKVLPGYRHPEGRNWVSFIFAFILSKPFYVEYYFQTSVV